MQLTTANLFLLLGACQGLVLCGVLLVAPYFRSRANTYLALVFGVVAILGINHALLYSGIESIWFTFSVDIMWEYLFPAFLLLYFAEALGDPLARSARRYWLYLPFLLTLMINVFIDLDVDAGWYHYPIFHHPGIDVYYVLEDAGTLVFALFTLAWSWRIVRRGKPRFPTDWFRALWWWSAGVMLIWMVLWVLFESGDYDYEDYVFAGVSLLFGWVTYRGVLQFKLGEEQFEIRRLRSERPAVTAQEPPDSPEVEETPEPNLHLIRLDRLMTEEECFRDPAFNRTVAAKKLGISTGYLSQQLSTRGTLNFSDYVNAYRVAEVKRLLLDPAFREYSLPAIGYEAGFNSKSTFYAAFKKATGLSPNAFRKQQ